MDANYTLMHKNIPVTDINIDDDTGSIIHIGDTFTAEHLPIGVHYKDNIINRRELNKWWSARAIPASRENIDAILYSMNFSSSQMLLTHCMGLSLSDQYWVKPSNSNIRWEDVNFFENDFSEDVGNLLFGDINPSNILNLCSPDNTSDGQLKKRWKIINDKRCLIKSGEGPFHQQPINEVIASKIMKRLDIPHTSYDLLWQKNQPYSICEDFITPDTELISAYRIMAIRPEYNHNEYIHYVSLCEEHGIKDIRQSLDKMIVLDYIIANEDRHFNNFGIIRNANTLEWECAAPIFDSGTSLGYNKLHINSYDDIKCKSFKNTHSEQLRLVTSYDWIDFSKLKDINEEIAVTLSDKRTSQYIDKTRRDEITNFLKNRIEHLEEITVTKNKGI